jgi:hypothetical protein
MMACNEGSNRKCEGAEESLKKIAKIKYGNSFGFCVGYCWKQIIITPDEILFEKMARDDNEPVNCERDFNCTDWISTNQNANLDNFFDLDEVIGCPDCADGGAAWVEVQTLTKTHKVTFEYMSPPDEISDLVSDLHELMLTFNDCN